MLSPIDGSCNKICLICSVLIQPRKTGKRPDMTQHMLTVTLSIITNKQTKPHIISHFHTIILKLHSLLLMIF